MTRKMAFSKDVAQTAGQGREISSWRRKPSFRDYIDVIVALVCLATMLGVTYFSELDRNYATSLRISAAIQRVLGIPIAAENTVDTRSTILVVENDEGQRLIAKTALERYGYNVALADNGTQALDVLRNAAGRVALIVFDTRNSSIQMIQQLKGIRPSVPILAAGPAGMKLQAGASARIDGPFTAMPLADAVQEVLRPHAL